jgi:hypothetical protein
MKMNYKAWIRKNQRTLQRALHEMHTFAKRSARDLSNMEHSELKAMAKVQEDFAQACLEAHNEITEMHL